MSIFPGWMNSNELRAYPLDSRYSHDIPDDFISDMQVFAPCPRNSAIDDSAKRMESSFVPSSQLHIPYVKSAVVTKYMATVVVQCDGCMLFCTRSLDSIVPYEPVEFVSENGTCSGWLSFGAFDKTSKFSFRGGESGAGRLDWRAIVFYPSSTIGSFRVNTLSDRLSGDIRFVAGTGLLVSTDVDENSVKLTLDPKVADSFMDPCYSKAEDGIYPEACSISGASAENGLVVLAFTSEKMTDRDIANLKNDLRTVGLDDYVRVDAKIQRKLNAAGFFDDFVHVVVKHKPGNSGDFTIVGYRLVYNVPYSDVLGLLQRNLEFSTNSGYHRPEYDILTRAEFLPKLAELYRHVNLVDESSADADDVCAIEDEKHGYELQHSSSNRYDTDREVLGFPGIPEYGVDPYEIGEIPVVRSDDSSPLRAVDFTHRVRCFLKTDYISDIFVEVVYRVGDTTKNSVIRKFIDVTTLAPVVEEQTEEESQD